MMDLGRIPPQAVEVEMSVIGQLLMDNQAIDLVADMLKPEHFYKQQSQDIYEAIMYLYVKGIKIDLMTVVEHLKGEINAFDITEYTNTAGSTVHIEDHSKIIIEKFFLRSLIKIGYENVTEAYNYLADPFLIASKIDKDIMDTFAVADRNKTQTPRTALQNTLKLMEANQGKGRVTGVPSGFSKIDWILHGWQPTDLIIIAARPGMGKTAFALVMCRNMLRLNHPCAMINLEMSNHQLLQRWISFETAIPLEEIQSGDLTETQWKAINDASSKIYELPFFMNDTAAQTLVQIKALIYRLVKLHGVKVVVIDHIGLIKQDREEKTMNRNDFVGLITSTLKAIAKDLNITVIGLSQLSRAVEKRDDKRPRLSDLRDSGNIEQDADIVAFLFRAWYYHQQDEDDMDSYNDGSTTENSAEFIIGKNRHGAMKSIRIGFQAQITYFYDYDRE